MAKKTKRMLAFLLALTLIAGQIISPAMAADDLPADAQVVETPVEGGTETTTTYTDPGSGAVTTVVETSTQSGNAQTDSVVSTTVDTGTTTIAGSTTSTVTTTESEWNSVTTEQFPGNDTPDDSGFTSNGGTETTTVTGQESGTHELIQDGPEFPIEETETSEGSETTTVVNTETKEKTDATGTSTSTTDNDYGTVSNTSTGWQTESGTTQEDTYSDAVINQNPGNVTVNVSQSKKTAEETIWLDVAKAVEDNLDLPTAGTTEKVDGNTREITEVTYIYDKANPSVVIGYTTTRTVITESVDEDEEYSRGETEYDTTTGNTITGTSTDVTYQMPEKPQGGTVKNPDGSTTVTTVEEITQETLDEEGNVTGTEVIGYKTTSVTTSADGLEVSTESESIFRTEITTSITTETTGRIETETTELTKDKTTITSTVVFYDSEGYELVLHEGKWVYAATLSTVRQGKEHGELKLYPAYATTTGNGVEGNKFIYNDGTADSSAIRVNTSEGSEWAGLMEIENNGQTFYIYCIDLDTAAIGGHSYQVQNVENVTYLSESDKAHIKAVGYYGYWGATGTDAEGNPVPGSLQALKNNLTAARNESIAAGKSFPLSEQQINSMTADDAITATQAALWNYGNQGSTVSDQQANATVTAVMQWLKQQASPAEMESTDIIEANEFATKASITVKDAVVDTSGQAVTDGSGNRYYNTDVAFTIDVSRNSLTGNLVISVVQNGKTVDSISLADDESNWLGKLTADGTTGTTVTFTDLQLAAGVDITLTLEGTQDLKEGVYVYSSTTGNSKASQTFAGLAKGVNEVDLSVDLQFTVSEPDVQVKDPGAEPKQTKVDTLVQKKTDTETVTRTYNDITEVTTVTEQTKRLWNKERNRQWFYGYDIELYDGDGGEDGGNGRRRGTTILDEEVPLADAPLTGDLSGIWAVISGLSLGGMALLNRKRKDEDA